MTVLVSAYVPYYNNASTLARVIKSIQAQTHPVAEILIIDDGSAEPDPLQQILMSFPKVKPIWQGQNRGRGAARAVAMEAVQHEFVLCCDATNLLAPQFVEQALFWVADPQVAAVFGRITQAPKGSLVHRWRGRHLFKAEMPMSTRRGALLSTYGALVRRSLVLEVGNYDPRLRHSEDADLGQRLRDAGHDVVFDPQLQITSIADNTLPQVLERYWRWNAGVRETISALDYLKLISYSIKVMARQDWVAHDPSCIPLSLLAPHYQFWRSWWRRRQGISQGQWGQVPSEAQISSLDPDP